MVFKQYWERAIKHFGKEAQMLKTQEECQELAEVIHFELKEVPVGRDRVLEEIADVYNMIHQLAMIYEISENEICKKAYEKMERTMDRIIGELRRRENG